MAKMDEKVSTIENSVLQMAQEKSDIIREQADSLREKEIKKAENDILQHLYEKIQEEISEIRTGTVKSISKQESDLRRQLLLRREEITNSVFGNVKSRLIEYTAGEKYEQYILDTAKRLAEQYPYSESVIQLRKEDYRFSAAINEIIGKNCRIMVGNNIQIGGMILMNQLVGIYVDETLDNKLQEQRPWFYSQSGLTVV